MPAASRTQSGRDSFLEVLRSEIAAESETLTAWVRQVGESGGIEDLFAMEAWLKGLRSFFRVEHVPLSPGERSELASRSFAPEMGVVRQAVEASERHACRVLAQGTGGKPEFEEFFEIQMRRDRVPDVHIGRIVEQLTPGDSLSRLSLFLNDLRVLIDAARGQEEAKYQVFLSLGRLYERELKSCRYIDMLLGRPFRMQYDLVENKALAAVLQKIPEDALRRDMAVALLHLFRFLKYLNLVALDLARDRPLQKHLALFALLHEEMGTLSDFLRARFLRNRPDDTPIRNAADQAAYSLKAEAQRVLERQLLFLARETDPAPVYMHVENAHGLLRHCCQSGILNLVRSIAGDFDATVLFPSRVESLAASEKLRSDLRDLRSWLTDVLENRTELDSNGIVARLAAFKETSLPSLMYRDWSEFETFSDALSIATGYIEIRTHIRKFVLFLESLIQEVSKRSVFRNGPPSC